MLNEMKLFERESLMRWENVSSFFIFFMFYIFRPFSNLILPLILLLTFNMRRPVYILCELQKHMQQKK